MIRCFFLGVLMLSFVSCQDSKQENPAIVQEGIFSPSSELNIKGSCLLDSMQFANGKYCYQLMGSFSVDDVTHSYTVVLANNPTQNLVSEVLSSSLSFNSDTVIYRNRVLLFEEYLMLVWESPGKRLKIEYADSLISRH